MLSVMSMNPLLSISEYSKLPVNPPPSLRFWMPLTRASATRSGGRKGMKFSLPVEDTEVPSYSARLRQRQHDILVRRAALATPS